MVHVTANINDCIDRIHLNRVRPFVDIKYRAVGIRPVACLGTFHRSIENQVRAYEYHICKMDTNTFRYAIMYICFFFFLYCCA